MLRRLTLLIVLILVVAACTSTPGTGTEDTSPTQSTTADGSSPSTGSPSTTLEDEGTTTTQPEPTWTELPGIEDLPQEVQDELLALVRMTEELRGLVFIEAPIITIVTDAELEARVRALIEEESADFPADDALYKLLGLLDEEVVLETLLTDLYGEQVAGFYDGETGELVVPMRSGGFSVVEKATMIHELTHSLTDQQFDFDPVIESMFDEERLDQASAYQGLVEGDATFTELLYLQGLSQRELGEFFAEASDVDSTTLNSSPQFIRDSLIFPYDSGLEFTQSLYQAGDWEAVNDAYSIMPGLPGSTEQVITPSDYQRDLPIEVLAETITLSGYDLERQSVWGEFGFRVMLDQVLGEATGLVAADGWGGDTYFQWFDGNNAAFLLLYEGDTEKDLEEMKDALVDYARTAVADEDFVWVEVFDNQLAFIAADEVPVGETIRSAMQG